MNLRIQSQRYLALGVATVALACMPALAQGGDPPPQSQGGGNAGSKGRPSIDRRPVEIPANGLADPGIIKPQRPGTVPTPQEVSDAIKKLQATREQYLQNSQATARAGKDSLSEDRAAIREQLQENIQRLREHQKALRKELKDRVEEMKGELSPDLGRVIAQVSFEGRGR